MRETEHGVRCSCGKAKVEALASRGDESCRTVSPLEVEDDESQIPLKLEVIKVGVVEMKVE